MDQNTVNTLLIGFALCCILPATLATLAGVWALWAGNQFVQGFITNDVAAVQKRYEKLRAKHPGAAPDVVAQKIINAEALRCGWIGALTSFGGFFTLPIALPIDLLLSARIQSEMVDLLALHYGAKQAGETEQKVKTMMVMVGGTQVAEAATKFLSAGCARLLTKFFAKLIPLAGALVGFGVNYAIARATGTIAAAWYKRKAA